MILSVPSCSDLFVTLYGYGSETHRRTFVCRHVGGYRARVALGHRGGVRGDALRGPGLDQQRDFRLVAQGVRQDEYAVGIARRRAIGHSRRPEDERTGAEARFGQYGEVRAVGRILHLPVYRAVDARGSCVALRVGIREDLITEDVLPGTPTMLQYKTHADADSLYNTPPAYGIYICGKVFKWLKKMGGLEVMKQRNEEKAKILYDFLDSSKMFKGTVVKEDRSLMNVPFVTGDKDLDAKFVKEAEEAGFVNLKGHRTVGGMRASIYNAMPKEGVEKLVEFMKKFEEENA